MATHFAVEGLNFAGLWQQFGAWEHGTGKSLNPAPTLADALAVKGDFEKHMAQPDNEWKDVRIVKVVTTRAVVG